MEERKKKDKEIKMEERKNDEKVKRRKMKMHLTGKRDKVT